MIENLSTRTWHCSHGRKFLNSSVAMCLVQCPFLTCFGAANSSKLHFKLTAQRQERDGQPPTDPPRDHTFCHANVTGSRNSPFGSSFSPPATVNINETPNGKDPQRRKKERKVWRDREKMQKFGKDPAEGRSREGGVMRSGCPSKGGGGGREERSSGGAKGKKI